MATILKRMDLTKVESGSTSDLDAEFLRQCKEQLNYTLPTQVMIDNEQRTKVLGVLREIGLPPFDEKTVEQYKMRQRFLFATPKYYWQCVFSLMVIVLAIPAICVMCGASWVYLWWCMPVVILVGVIGVVANCAAVEDWKWSWYNLPVYSRPIPTFALQTAMDVKQRLDALDIKHSFAIYMLERHARAADPFLVLNAGNHEYYIEVWNEPSFDAKRVD